MKSLLVVALLVVLSVGLVTAHHRHHDVAAGSLVLSPVAAIPVRTVERIHATATPSGSRPHRASTCTDQHWRRFLGPDERWIDRRESQMDPAAVEPSTGAFGLGQLLPATYGALGLVPSSSPCREIAAQRAYADERYGSWANARAFWTVNRWW